jgi:hypothetical protein
MPVFTAIAAAVTAVTGFTFLGSVAAFGAKMVLFNGISKLIGNRQGSNGSGTTNAGSRVQLPPSTDNKLPVVYGTAYVAPSITDAMISTDQKYMWYVCTLAEVTNTMPGQTPDTYSFGDIYYGGKLVTFGTGADAAKVVSLTTNTNTPQVDTNINGKIYMYKFTNGSSSGVNTGGQTAIQILSDSSTGGGIPLVNRWSSTDTMTNAAFLVVRVEYDTNAGTTGLDQISVQLTNPLSDPGAVIYDYMYNNVYGCAIPSDQIDTVSLADLTAYSAEQIDYNPVGGGTVSQNRYVINGPLNTGNNCLGNLQQLVDACDSWLQYSELSGKWKIVINQSYTQAGQTLGQLYSVNSNVLIGGIDINPIDLNDTYNSLEVQYPNTNIKDQTDFQVVDLTDPSKPWYDPYLLSPNEADNRLVIQYQTVNNYIQALYLGVRRLLQSREDLTINCMLDYSGIQIEAGDVIKVTLAEYGWVDKLFRVNQVQEAKLEDGSLGARITAFEYNDSVYVDNVLQDFVPSDNTGLSDPTVLGTPIAPTVTNQNIATNTFNINAIVPTGAVIGMEFWYSIDGGTNYIFYQSSNSTVGVFPTGATVSVGVQGAPPATYLLKVRAVSSSTKSLYSPTFSLVWPTVPNAPTADPGTGGTGVTPPTQSDIENNLLTVSITTPSSGDVPSLEWDFSTDGGTNWTVFNRTYPPSGLNYPNNTIVSTVLRNGIVADYTFRARVTGINTASSYFTYGTNYNWAPLTPNSSKPNPQTYELIACQTVSYSSTYGVWANNTRGVVAQWVWDGSGSNPAPPRANGFDTGGLPTSRIDMSLNASVYSATSPTTGLCLELWQGLPSNSRPQSMAFGAGYYVIPDGDAFAGFIDGQIYSTAGFTTPTGYAQTTLSTPSGLGLPGAVYGGGKFVVAGQGGTIYTSTTGLPNSWTLQTTGLSYDYTRIRYNGSVYIAVGGVDGSGAIVATSSDAITWTLSLNTTGIDILYDIAFNGSTWVAVGKTGAVAYSSNSGSTWSIVSFNSPPTVTYNFYGVTYNSSTNSYCAVGEQFDNFGNATNVIITATTPNTNPTNWTEQTPVDTTILLSSIASDGTLMFASGLIGSFARSIMYSNDGGVTWVYPGSGFQGASGQILFTNYVNSKFYFASLATDLFIMEIFEDVIADRGTSNWPTSNLMGRIERIATYGANQTDPFNTTIQPVPNQIPNNIPVTLSGTTGDFYGGGPISFLVVGGDLNNPSNPSTPVVCRISISATEYA